MCPSRCPLMALLQKHQHVPSLGYSSDSNLCRTKRHSASKNWADRGRSGLETISQDSKANSNRFIIDFHFYIFSIQDVEAHLLYNCKLSMSTFPINCIFCNDGGWHRPPQWGNYPFVFGIPCACIYRMWTDFSTLTRLKKKKKKDPDCPVINPLLLPPIEILITSKVLIEFSYLYANHRVSLTPTVQAGYFSY